MYAFSLLRLGRRNVELNLEAKAARIEIQMPRRMLADFIVNLRRNVAPGI